jgi:hypothetical protein
VVVVVEAVVMVVEAVVVVVVGNNEQPIKNITKKLNNERNASCFFKIPSGRKSMSHSLSIIEDIIEESKMK